MADPVLMRIFLNIVEGVENLLGEDLDEEFRKVTSAQALQATIDISGENEAPLVIVENIPCDFFLSFVRWQEKATYAA